ncbi:hypothetical protein IAQ61_000403 [Plenodomus lingam]|uniref:uncharacterized protein n=1 Tax=Leptosphaeria maculans TaxID=5022 RepID=UPI0033214AB4|nr:hypothetical protein IAQ61_000403 [Plenodomus lingam]
MTRKNDLSLCHPLTILFWIHSHHAVNPDEMDRRSKLRLQPTMITLRARQRAFPLPETETGFCGGSSWDANGRVVFWLETTTVPHYNDSFLQERLHWSVNLRSSNPPHSATAHELDWIPLGGLKSPPRRFDQSPNEGG